MWKQLAPVALLLTVLATPACLTERESSPPGLDSTMAQHAVMTRAWTVNERGSRAGSVARYEAGGEQERYFYVVRNRHDQDLGIIDALGRIYRNRPHGEPEWVGSGTVLQGVMQILELGPRTELLEVPVTQASGSPGQ
jgi:hypothetical protein